MSKGWECPKCKNIFAPAIDECRYCKPADLRPTIPNGCIHEWDNSSILLTDPPQLKCKKCNKLMLVSPMSAMPFTGGSWGSTTGCLS